MIQQQRTGRSLSAEVGAILRERGLLKFYRGLVSTLARAELTDQHRDCKPVQLRDS